jgi:AraC-like DNA-binding protein
MCTSGPQDRPFEEQHQWVSIAVVVAGSFQYRSGSKQALMTPGSLLLGSAGESFKCGHDHAMGDRCVAFWYQPEYFERISSDAGVHRPKAKFAEVRIPAVRDLSPMVTRACGGINGKTAQWEELAIRLAGMAAQLANGVPPGMEDPLPSAQRATTRVLRMLEEEPQANWTLERMAEAAGLSPYHFLRMFEAVAGVTPHQFVLRSRLRNAAMEIASAGSKKVVDIALGCGFGDVSNFNRAFKRELGVSPREWRKIG